ncbi:hypothetical protein SI65_00386 [Aspergillus cristatus]|uniref:Uncharacterized protein n=1 Tax=Aspergillus cristatus TaxID=573508 RepID=A0A1E3BPI8_ASPCR|nr:hypothetical protein SI65_00386 [Aspergillus cristatus]
MAVENGEETPSYRASRPVPFELVQHSGIFFEEKLYTQALNLLINIITSGTVASGPVFVPSPPLLAVAATFLVHPSTTTRARSPEEQEAPSAALRLLRLTNTLVGPITARFDTAFAFTHFEASRHGGIRRRASEDEGTSGNEMLRNEWKLLNTELGQSSAVWSRAEDFWHAVGWAFNCSVLHPERWERWQVWLQFMCEVLEDDWNERKRHVEREVSGAGNGKEKKRLRQNILQQSLIFQYIDGSSGSYGRNRRILRAIFADGTSGSVNEFREVFRNELKQLKRDQENIKKREAEVNIDEEQYGDYMTKDEDESEEGDGATDNPMTTERRSKRTRRRTRNTTAEQQPTATVTTNNTLYSHGTLSLLGGLPSLALRQRLLHLLSAVSESLPDIFTTLEELYHLFIENIRHLPLPIYQSFISPHVLPHFSAAAQTTLCEFLLFRLRESTAPETEEEYLSQTKLEQCFLPYAASTASVVDNTKMALALEALVMLLAESEMLKVTPELRTAVEDGIMARAERAQDVKRNQSSKQVEDIEWCWLIESGERLLFMINELVPSMEAS